MRLSILASVPESEEKEAAATVRDAVAANTIAALWIAAARPQSCEDPRMQ